MNSAAGNGIALDESPERRRIAAVIMAQGGKATSLTPGESTVGPPAIKRKHLPDWALLAYGLTAIAAAVCMALVG